MAKARLHSFWRGLIVALVGLAVNGVSVWLVLGGFLGVPRTWWKITDLLRPWIGGHGTLIVRWGVLCGTPTLIAAFGVHSFLSRRLGGQRADEETHCRACDHILRGLSEPRCPECGEAI